MSGMKIGKLERSKQTWGKAKQSTLLIGCVAVAAAAITAIVVLAPICHHHMQVAHQNYALSQKFYASHFPNGGCPPAGSHYWDIVDKVHSAFSKSVYEGLAMGGLGLVALGALGLGTFRVRQLYHYIETDKLLKKAPNLASQNPSDL